MLEELIKEIRNGGTYDTAQLAARLNTTPKLVMAMLEHLKRMGMLRNYEACGSSCEGCNLGSTCNTRGKNDNVHLYTLS